MKRHNIIDLVDDTDDASTDKQTNPNKRQQTQPIKSESKQSETSTPPLSQTSPSSQSHDDIEYGFYLNEIRGLNNQHSIKLSDLVTGAIEQAVLLNYCWDLPWLLKEIPLLARIPNVHLVSGQRDTDLKQQAYDTKLTNIRVHLASLPVHWGCHHSKCLLLFYNHGCRVIIMTANFLECDLHYKNQAIWYQDFPLKPADRTSICNTEVGTDFERTLKEYFAVYRKCGLDVIESIEKYDFSAAKAILIPALPGAFVNESIRKLGHMKVRHWLTKQVMSSEMQAAPVVAQFSSLGSLSEKWMNEFTLSLSQHADRGISNRLPELKIVWPRTVDVQWSVEGWAAGGSLCCDTKNVKPHVLSRYHRWDGLAQNRHRAMPHIKSYSRACASRIGFAIVGSANFSTAAWGALQKADSQIALRHYEMSVLVASFVYEKLRSLKHPNYWFSCTDQRMERAPLSATTTVLQSASRAIAKRDEHSVLCPFPYDIHPKPYAKDDKGWVWDQPFSEPDVHSMKWCGARSKAEES